MRKGGRPAIDIDYKIERELTEVDLQKEVAVEKAPALTRLTQRHHRLARLIADGLSSGDAALAAGYSHSRVSILMNDVLFSQLVDAYSRQVKQIYVDVHEKLVDLAVTASDELLTRLENSPEVVDNTQLLSIIKIAADRTGHAPVNNKQTNNIFVGFGRQLDEAQQKVVSAPIPQMIEGKVVDD